VYARISLVAGIAALAACSSAPPLESGGAVTVADSSVLPAPSSLDQMPAPREYLIGPQDQLSVEVWGVPDLSREIMVDASEQIAVPRAGTLMAAGKTPDLIDQEITARLTRYVKDPDVSVNVREATSRVVTVDGEVEMPGNYPVTNNMTLLRAIAAARGETEFADRQEVVIFRTVGGQKLAALYNLGAIRRGVYEDPTIYPNDTVIVGESGSRRLLQYAIQAGPALLTPLVYILSNR